MSGRGTEKTIRQDNRRGEWNEVWGEQLAPQGRAAFTGGLCSKQPCVEPAPQAVDAETPRFVLLRAHLDRVPFIHVSYV